MTFAWCLPVQTNLPGIFIPGARWGASVIRFGVGGMYQVMRMVGLEPGARTCVHSCVPCSTLGNAHMGTCQHQALMLLFTPGLTALQAANSKQQSRRPA